MIVELLDFYFPVNFVLRSMFNCNWKITSIIESSELTGRDSSSVYCSCFRFLGQWLVLGFQQTCGFSSKTLSFFQNGYKNNLRTHC